MRNEFPFDYEYPVDSFSYEQKMYQTLLRQQQREVEMARRQAELERMERIKREYALHQYRQEQERLRLAEAKRMQQEKILRQRLAAAKSIKARAHSERVQQPHPTSTIIRGPDGRLYRVLLDRGAPQSHTAKKHVSTTDVSDGSKSCKIQKPKPRVIPDKQVDTGLESGMVSNKDLLPSSTPVENDINVEISISPSHNNSFDEIRLGEVEDASDDECEDEFSSVWNNRRPSEGQWIEPVECA
jgi:hypothetical protein